MAIKKDNQNDELPLEERRRIKLYALVTLVLIIGAIIFASLPKGTRLQQCEGIALSSNKDSCLMVVAISTKNSSICGMMHSGIALGCYINLAESTQNESLCAKAYLINQTSGGECSLNVANATSDYSICNTLSEPYRDTCLLKAATKSSDPQLCAMISNGNSMAVCSSSIAIGRAYYTSNASDCAIVSNSLDKRLIQNVITNTSGVFSHAVGNVSTLISEFAVLPNQNVSSRDLCYTILASKLGNSSYCSNTGPQAEKLCGVAANQTTKNYSSNNMNFTALLNNCQLTQYQSYCTTYVLLDEAVLTKNVSICAGFPTYTSWQCYESIAKNYNNATYCSYITNSTANSACLLSLNIKSTG